VEVPAISEAKAFLKVSCAAAKESCAQTTAIHDEYLVVLSDALTCMGTPCSVAKVNEIYNRDRKLDEREHLLPHKARSIDSKRPLLRLSLFVITAAGLALKAADPKAEAPSYTNYAVEASKVVEDICSLGAGNTCAEARGMINAVDALNSGAGACEAKACAFPEQERLAISAEKSLGSYFVLSEKSSYNTVSIYGMLSDARVRIAVMLARTSASKLAELEAGEKALLAGVDKLEKNPGGAGQGAQIDALKARETAVLALYKDASITSDRTQSLLGSDPAKDRSRERINVSAAHLASARGRLIALKTAQGFGGGPEAGAAGAIRAAFAAAGDATLGIAVLGTRPAAAPRPIPIDRRTVPIAPPLNPSAPPILKTAPGFFDLFGNSRSKDPLIRADALRRLGLTNTLGDPSGRAPLVHPQKGGETCAIVAQQQILMAHGLIAKGDPVKIEAALAKEAQERGFYIESAGTARAYQADLLIDRGLIVTKQTAAPLETLDAAVRRGGMIIASVDARYLWNVKSPKTLGHAIVITGAEVGRFDGKTLGYYINDSGVSKDGAGRFVPIEQFTRAWNNHTKSFAEVQ
jgi:hypothetical protein